MASAATDHTVQSIQLLRALAAGTVAVVHLAFAFSDHVGVGLGMGPAITRVGEQAAQVAVALFFLVSGYIMVVSSRPMFGMPGGSRRFLIRRAVRIAPAWWIATLVLAGLYMWIGQQFAPGDLARSLAFVPYWSDGLAPPMQPLPLLWPGWTLFYEALFYLLFGLGVTAGQRWAVGLSAGVLLALVCAGQLLEPQSALLFALTRPVTLVFVAGMALAIWREGGRSVPAWLRLLLAVAGVLAMVYPPGSGVPGLGADWLAWAGTPALLLFLAAVGGPLKVPCFAQVNLLGGASYALYLLHVPMGHLWSIVWPGRLYAYGAWPYFLCLVAATVAVAIAFWLMVERPLTSRLNALLLPERSKRA